MTVPEVQAVLDYINDDWQGTESDIANVPLERIDRDNSDLLDDSPTHEMTPDLEGMNYVGAATASISDEPLGSDYDVETTRTVDVRVVGAHASEFGAIDPQSGTADAINTTHNTTTWTSLVDTIRSSILQKSNRTFPTVNNRSNIGYKDLFIENWQDQSRNYGDHYRLDFTVRFVGFEDLPD